MNRVLVTGGAGFIGSHIVEALLSKGCQVAVVDNLSTGKREHVPSGVDFYRCDICSAELAAVFAAFQPEYIVHAAAQVHVGTSLEKPDIDAQTNILGSLNVLELARCYGCRRVVYSSSAAVYGNPEYLPVDETHPLRPISPYGISKHTVEHYLYIYRELYDLDYVVLRYANVYGPRQDASGEGGVVAIFADRLLEGRSPIVYGDGEQTRDFVYVKDVALANVLALTVGGGHILNVSSGTETSIGELLGLLQAETGYQGQVLYQDERPGEIRRSILCNRQLGKILNWKQEVDLVTGLKATVEEVGKSVMNPPKGVCR
ncbi:MAG: NAD-dependent epimerase/dehydratase family protein [Firmicutes bacterium]|nr:NAD-dependent epimerase/dehydratase family protein [Bacillota bacterium]